MRYLLQVTYLAILIGFCLLVATAIFAVAGNTRAALITLAGTLVIFILALVYAIVAATHARDQDN